MTRARGAAGAVLALSAVWLVACAPSPPVRVVSGQPGVSTASAAPAAHGRLIGGIRGCFGIPPSPPAPAPYLPGSVEVFTASASAQEIPVASTEVADGGMFTFSLPPGHYSVVAASTATNFGPLLADADVTAGATTRVDLAYTGCK